MAQWLTSAVLIVLAVVVFLWLQTDRVRLDGKGQRRGRCPHQDPGIDCVTPLETPGEVKTVYYCPDCKSVWSEVTAVSQEEWERLVVEAKGGGK